MSKSMQSLMKLQNDFTNEQIIEKGEKIRLLFIQEKKDIDLANLEYINNELEKARNLLTPISEDWKEAIKDQWWMQSSSYLISTLGRENGIFYYYLREHLLEFAGDAVCLEEDDPYLVMLITYGQLRFSINNSLLVEGFQSECHANCFNINHLNNRYYVCTGYALSDDSMWRRHSWLLDSKSNVIIETTKPRVLYYGFILVNELSENLYNEAYMSSYIKDNGKFQEIAENLENHIEEFLQKRNKGELK